MTKKQILERLKGTDDYTFISSKMGDVVVSHLVETILEWLVYDKKIYENKAGESDWQRQNREAKEQQEALIKDHKIRPPTRVDGVSGASQSGEQTKTWE